MTGIERIAAERARQIEVEGFTAEHDDKREYGVLLEASACYQVVAVGQMEGRKCKYFPPPEIWPWLDEWWKPSPDPIRNLEIAGALIAAEIDRLLRERGKK